MRSIAALLSFLTIVSTSDLSAKISGVKISGVKISSKNPGEGAGKDASHKGLQLAAESPEATQPEDRDDADDPAPPPVLPTDEELTFERPRDLNLLTGAEMLSLAEKYQADIEDNVAHVEAARSIAYRNRDVIKLTCIDDKLVQIKLISHTTGPRFSRLIRIRDDEFAVRAEFNIITPNWKKSKDLRAEVETCIGESLNSVSVVTVSQENPEPGGGPDPTQPPGPKVNSERLPEASPWR